MVPLNRTGFCVTRAMRDLRLRMLKDLRSSMGVRSAEEGWQRQENFYIGVVCFKKGDFESPIRLYMILDLHSSYF